MNAAMRASPARWGGDTELDMNKKAATPEGYGNDVRAKFGIWSIRPFHILTE